MSTFNYTEMKDVVDEMLAEFGGSFTITRIAQGNYTPATGVAGTNVPQDLVYRGFVMPQGVTQFVEGKHYLYRDEFHGGTSVESDDIEVLLAPTLVDGTASPIPQLDDVIDLGDGAKHSIFSVDPILPNGVDVVYVIIKARK
jgi:hypothetical protein